MIHALNCANCARAQLADERDEQSEERIAKLRERYGRNVTFAEARKRVTARNVETTVRKAFGRVWFSLSFAQGRERWFETSERTSTLRLSNEELNRLNRI